MRDDFPEDVPPDLAGATLTIDLDAVAENWRRLCRQLGKPCAGVVKADGYGLGLGPVARTLAAAGCDTFFVALPEEGLRLRRILPHPEARIFVLTGAPEGAEGLFATHRLVPVLNTLEQAARWLAAAPAGAPHALHVDTGMTRLGLPAEDIEALPGGLAPCLVMSHLACSDEPGHALNAAQAAAFAAARARFPQAEASLANSSGVFLGASYAFDLGRPGIALYGGNPTPGAPNPMRQVVTLQAKILQVRRVDTPRTVGYGASARIEGGSLLATVAAGYADGLHRALGNVGSGLLGDRVVPMVGRVSMDLIVFDVSAAPADLTRPGQSITLIGGRHDADALAAEAGTISYEILTSLGHRYARTYLGGA
ncbi:alanine racemase [Novispirillum sp. DQ9]|uniref:alanine racemase n=1 Tax=Novispirillum sp. DQ9 TaxID=3398612 RepID=UPI003C7E924B